MPQLYTRIHVLGEMSIFFSKIFLQGVLLKGGGGEVNMQGGGKAVPLAHGHLSFSGSPELKKLTEVHIMHGVE